MSFVFYDTETTGTNTSFDQILQFAAIKTDSEMRELDRVEARCRLLPYVVPSPGAMCVTGVTVDQLIDPALPTHYQMVRTIKAKLEEWSPAVFIGHNSLGFDEHLLRQALYKTLHSPYLTNTNGNSRTDSLRMAQAVNLLAPEVLSVPAGEKGKLSFKLDKLAPANGFDHVAAHDAMGDVEATIHICRILAQRADAHWSNFMRFAQKAAVLNFAREEEVFLLTDFYFGRAHSWMVTSIGPNPGNTSELLVFDLSVDPEELSQWSDDELAARLGSRPKPVRSLRANAGPCILSYADAPEHLKTGVPEIDVLQRHALRIKSDESLAARLIGALLLTREEKQQSEHVEDQIYDGFAESRDQAIMAEFHFVDWPIRAQLLDQLSDARLKTLGRRLIHSEAPELLSDQARSDYDAAIARRLMADAESVPWLTLPQAIEDTEDMIAVTAGAESALLRALHKFLVQKAEKANALMT